MNEKTLLSKAISVLLVPLLVISFVFVVGLDQTFAVSRAVDTYELASYSDVMSPNEKEELDFIIPETTSVDLSLTIDLWGEYDNYEIQDTTCHFYIKKDDSVVYDYSADSYLVKRFKLQKGEYTLEIHGPSDCYVEINLGLSYDLNMSPTYKEISKKAKGLGTKNIKYRNLDVGYHSRLYGKGIVTDIDLHSKELYAMFGSFQPYIDIKKNGNTANLRLAIMGKSVMTSYFYDQLWFDKVRFYTKDRTITFDLGNCTSRDKYDYSTGIYTTTTSWWATLSSDRKPRADQLNKLITIFKHKNIRVRVYEQDGTFYWLQLSEPIRKNWLATFQKYKKLLAMY